jgi:hypothetical protein
MASNNRRNLKLLSAVIGGSAVVAMSALSLAIAQEQAGPETVAKSSHMTVGSTFTQTTPSNAEATSMAVPTLKGPAPLPSEEKAAQ